MRRWAGMMMMMTFQCDSIRMELLAYMCAWYIAGVLYLVFVLPGSFLHRVCCLGCLLCQLLHYATVPFIYL
jgi:lauroyl/myristoyl acyltransferase